MDRTGAWQLAPAFDVAYSFNPDGDWTSQHQMSLAGLRDNFTLDSLVAGGESAGISASAVKKMLGEVTAAVGDWRAIATGVCVPPAFVDDVEGNLRLDIL